MDHGTKPVRPQDRTEPGKNVELGPNQDQNDFENLRLTRTDRLSDESVDLCIKNISSEQFSYSIVNPPRNTFHINQDDIISEVKENTRLICVMLGLASKTLTKILYFYVGVCVGSLNRLKPNQANNETGAIQPVKAIGLNIKEMNQSRDVKIKFLVDASQCIGKIKVDVTDLNCDFCIIAGHKVYFSLKSWN